MIPLRDCPGSRTLQRRENVFRLHVESVDIVQPPIEGLRDDGQ
jgi:hypothetical protein